MQINLPDKLYYSIGEVAKAFDVNTSLLRFWEKEFTEINPKKNKKGNRYFSKIDIENIKLIYHLVKERGYTLDGARVALRENKDLTEEISIIHHLEKIKSELEELKTYFDEEND